MSEKSYGFDEPQQVEVSTQAQANRDELVERIARAIREDGRLSR